MIVSQGAAPSGVAQTSQRAPRHDAGELAPSQGLGGPIEQDHAARLVEYHDGDRQAVENGKRNIVQTSQFEPFSARHRHARTPAAHSHSMVPGGFEVTS